MTLATYLVLFMIIFIFLAVNFQSKLIVAVSQNPWLLYQDSSNGFSFQYHQKWKLSQEPIDDFNVVNLEPPHSSRNVDYLTSFTVGIDRGSVGNQSMTSIEYAQKVLDLIQKNYRHFQIIENVSKTTLSGKPAYQFIYTDLTSADERLYKTMEVGAVINDRVFFIEYVSQDPEFSKHMPTIQKMLSSFQISESASSAKADADSILGNKELQRFTPFKNTKTGVSLMYPSEWERQNGDPMGYAPVYGSTYNFSVYFYTPLEGRLDPVQEYFLLQAENWRSSSVTIEEYANETLDILKESIMIENGTDFTVLEYNSTTLAGIKAYKILSTYTLEGKEYERLDIFAILDNLVYYTSFETEAQKYPSFSGVLDAIYKSFRLEGQPLFGENRA